jgi:hypothetical protein
MAQTVATVQQARAEAARKLQLAFLAHRCRQVYRQLWQFIRASEGRDPRLAFTAIGQSAEAALADAAAGVRVRFRLDGTCTKGRPAPPALVYTVVTRRPVVRLQLGGPGPTEAPGAAERPNQWRAVPQELYRRAAGLSRLTKQLRASASATRQAILGNSAHPPARVPHKQGTPGRQRQRQQMFRLYEQGRLHEAEAATAVASSCGEDLPQPSSSGRPETGWPLEERAGEGSDDTELELWSRGLLELDFEEYAGGWRELGGSAWTDGGS